MKIVFMGTPDFAVPSLKALLNEGHRVLAVYSQPDKPKGRGHKLQAPPVKELALENGIKVLQPESFKSQEVVEELAAMEPDCIVVVAYGRLLPEAVLKIPKQGCINVHGSLLPKYRGAAPIQWSVLNGDKLTGVTTMFMACGMDTGDILLKAETEIGENETSGQLFDRLKLLGARLLLQTLRELDSISPMAQDHTAATHAPMINKEMSPINWQRSALELHNQVRGLNPWPCAITELQGKRIKLLETRIMPGKGEPGKPFVKEGKLCVYCGEDALELCLLQPENGKCMGGGSYLLGHPLK